MGLTGEWGLVAVLLFVVAVLMTMVGKGGGNFYVLILVLLGSPMHQAATTGQFLLFSASAAALLFFQRNRKTSWKLALLMSGLMAVPALLGGYLSSEFGEGILKLVFAAMLIVAGAVMLKPVQSSTAVQDQESVRFGVMILKSGAEKYFINLKIVVPVAVVTGFCSGMVGVSGGSFFVPLMVLVCRVPMHTAVGTASVFIAVTAFMGFLGHAANGHFDAATTLPLAVVTVLGGLIGGKSALKSKPWNLKALFAVTNWIAAALIVLHALRVRGIL